MDILCCTASSAHTSTSSSVVTRSGFLSFLLGMAWYLELWLMLERPVPEAAATAQENRPLATAAADGRDMTNRRRRWYLGIQSKKDPVHVMNEVYKAMQALQCV